MFDWGLELEQILRCWMDEWIDGLMVYRLLGRGKPQLSWWCIILRGAVRYRYEGRERDVVRSGRGWCHGGGNGCWRHALDTYLLTYIRMSIRIRMTMDKDNDILYTIEKLSTTWEQLGDRKSNCHSI